MNNNFPKIYTLSPKENWICDRFVSEWNEHIKQFSVSDPADADIIWLLADWCWASVDPKILKEKTVVASVHHLVPEKLGIYEKQEFNVRDPFVDFYHVPCKKTFEQVKALTKKPIFCQPFWVNSDIWISLSGHRRKGENSTWRFQNSLPDDKFLIGSFQRDTEGKDLVSPKLEKGPDIFCNVVEFYHKKNKNVEVVLAGWRRQYVMSRLDQAGIKYHYFELPSFKIINELYNCLDLYVVGARHEGGPQAIFECAATCTPIISTNVGYASELLHPKSMFKHDLSDLENAVPVTNYAFENVQKILTPYGFLEFVKFFTSIVPREI